MAKSLRSKVKRSYRSKKRNDSVYSATEAARLNRLNAKLKSITSTGNVENEESNASAMEEDLPAQDAEGNSAMEENSSPEKRISTHGRNSSGREQWRLSRGMTARPGSRGMNRQGGVAARRHAGRSKRRR